MTYRMTSAQLVLSQAILHVKYPNLSSPNQSDPKPGEPFLELLALSGMKPLPAGETAVDEPLEA